MADPCNESKPPSPALADHKPAFDSGADSLNRTELAQEVAVQDGFSGEIRKAFAAILGVPVDVKESLNRLDYHSHAPKQIGEFHIVREIGRGGMGIVYEAVQESLGRTVALKVLPVSVATHERMVRRFQLESRSAAKLHHTNIVPVYAVGQAEGVHYYAMQCIQGCGLNVVVNEMKRQSNQQDKDHPCPDACKFSIDETNKAATVVSHVFGSSSERASEPASQSLDNNRSSVVESFESTRTSISDSTSIAREENRSSSSLIVSGSRKWDAIAKIGLQAAEALHYAATHGILHRDVKPSNLLLDDSCNVWLTDFGLAKSEGESDLTQQGDILGTLRYLPPERLRGVADARGDLYGLGVTLYELLTLRAAFPGRERVELLSDIANRQPAAPRSIDPTIPRDLETIVMKLMDKEPARRYASGEIAAADFQAFLDRRPIRARKVTWMEHTFRWCRRNPALSGALGCVAMLTFSLIGILWNSNLAIRKESFEKSIALDEKNQAFAQAERNLELLTDANDLAYQRFYASQMNLASQAFDQGEVARARELLDSLRPRDGQQGSHDFMWRYFNHAIQEKIHCTIDIPSHEIRSIEFSRDGSRLLVASGQDGQGDVSEFDADTGQQTHRYEPGKDFVKAVYFEPTDKVIAVTKSASVYVWSRGEHKPSQVRAIGAPVQSVLLTRDNRLLLIGDTAGNIHPLRTANCEVGEPLHIHNSQVSSLSQPTDEPLVFSSNRWSTTKELCTIDTRSDKLVLKEKIPTEYVGSVGGTPPRAASIYWGQIQLFEPSNASVLATRIVSFGQIRHCQFSRDGQFLLALASQERKGLVLSSKDLSQVDASVHHSTVSAMSIDRQSRRWASGDVEGRIFVFGRPGLEPKKQTWSFEGESILRRVGSELVVSSNAGLTVFSESLQDQNKLESVTGFLRAASSDGKTVVTGSSNGQQHKPTEKITIWDWPAKKAKMSWEVKSKNAVFVIAMSNDGKHVAYQVENEPIEVWDVSGNEPKRLHQFSGLASLTLQFCTERKLLVAAGFAGAVKCWNYTTGESLGTLLRFPDETGWVMKCQFSMDGRYLACGHGSGIVRVYDFQVQKTVSVLTGHTGEVGAIEFLPDGRNLIVGGVRRLKVFDFLTGQEIATLPNDDYKIADIAFTKDGNSLLTLTREGTLRSFTAPRSSGQVPTTEKPNE